MITYEHLMKWASRLAERVEKDEEKIIVAHSPLCNKDSFFIQLNAKLEDGRYIFGRLTIVEIKNKPCRHYGLCYPEGSKYKFTYKITTSKNKDERQLHLLNERYHDKMSFCIENFYAEYKYIKKTLDKGILF